jgi:hypothetical protein
MSPPAALETVAIASLPLGLAPLALLAGAAAAALTRSGSDRERSKRYATRAMRVAIATAAIPLAAAAPKVVEGARVLDAGLRVARVGSLDVTLACSLDRAGAGAALILLAALAVGTRSNQGASPKDATPAKSKRERKPVEASAGPAYAGSLGAWLVAGAGALGAVLADNLPTAIAGLGAIALGSLIGARSMPRTSVLAALAVGVFALATATAWLGWSLGGQWLDGLRYLADFGPRFVATGTASEAVPAQNAALRRPGAKGSLTLLAYPGARVYLGVADEAQLARAEPLATSPFVRVPVPAGLHKIAIALGDAASLGEGDAQVALVDAVPIGADAETRLVLEGASLTFRDLAHAAGSKLGERRIGRARAVPWIAALLAAAFAALVAGAASHTEPSDARRFGPLALLATATVTLRLAGLWSLATSPAVLGAAAIAAAAVIAATRGREALPREVRVELAMALCALIVGLAWSPALAVAAGALLVLGALRTPTAIPADEVRP